MAQTVMYCEVLHTEPCLSHVVVSRLHARLFLHTTLDNSCGVKGVYSVHAINVAPESELNTRFTSLFPALGTEDGVLWCGNANLRCSSLKSKAMARKVGGVALLPV